MGATHSERIWEKGPYRTKTKLKLRLKTPVGSIRSIFFIACQYVGLGENFFLLLKHNYIGSQTLQVGGA